MFLQMLQYIHGNSLGGLVPAHLGAQGLGNPPEGQHGPAGSNHFGSHIHGDAGAVNQHDIAADGELINLITKA